MRLRARGRSWPHSASILYEKYETCDLLALGPPSIKNSIFLDLFVFMTKKMSSTFWHTAKALPSAQQKALGKVNFDDKTFLRALCRV